VNRLFRLPMLAALAALVAISGLTVAGGDLPSAAASAQGGASPPRYDHVFMLTEENHGFDQIVGNPAAPTINNLAHAYGYASNYYGITHPSGPNYVATLGGGTFGVASDTPYWLFHVNAPNLMSQMDAAHKSWKGYFQGMPYAGYKGYCYPVRCMGIPDSDTLYIAKHNGMAYFNSVNSNPAEMAKMQPLGQLQKDLTSGTVPNFSYIMPDECHDMHGAPPVCVDSGSPGDVHDKWLVSTADAFVADTISQITASRVWATGNNAIVITFDEGDSGDNSGLGTKTGGGGRALTVVVTNRGSQHVVDATGYNHYSLLSGLQHAFGLGCLAATCDTSTIKPMAPLFALDPAAPAMPVPASLLTHAPIKPAPSGPPTATTPVSAPAAPAADHGHWQVIPSPNLSNDDNNLAAISAPTANDAWAVGNYYSADNPDVFRNLALHWDGRRWTAIAVPNAGDQENTLFGVSALPTGQAWAAGYYADADYRIRTLIEHYDGKAWRVVPSPDPGAKGDMLFSVNAVNDHDVWAVGGSQTDANGGFRTLIEHWDGRRWSAVASPNPGPNGNELFGVTAAGPANVWAVGQEQGNAFPGKALVEHWNGDSWQVAPGPAQHGYTFDPYAATVSGSQLVAVGTKEDGKDPQSSLAFTVTGSHAATSVTPQVGSFENDFYGLTSAGKTTWAAGRSADSDPNVQNHVTLVEQLVHGRWTVMPTPNPGGTGGDNGFGGISAAPGGPVWAVGTYKTSSSANQTLIERYVP
jgi:hypothetical protein